MKLPVWRQLPYISPSTLQKWLACQHRVYLSRLAGFKYQREPQGYAAAIGLNSERFDQCLDSGKYRDYVSRDQAAAVVAGARGTPTFYINGEIVDFFYESMEAKIVQELNS